MNALFCGFTEALLYETSQKSNNILPYVKQSVQRFTERKKC